MPSNTPQDHKTSKKTARKRTKTDTAQPIPQPVDPQSTYAPNTWLSGGVGTAADLTCPSGQKCLAIRPGMEGLMKAGVLHNADSLSRIVNEKHLKRVSGKSKEAEVDMSSLMGDSESLAEVVNVVDKIVCHIVVKPEIHRTPDDVTRRVPGVVYADMVDLEDKMFLFNYAVGGTSDLESFRQQFDESLGGLETGEGVLDEA